MAQALASDPRGLKRICMSCSSRFYDLNKRPIVCPNCEVEFNGEVKIKARRGRLAAIDLPEAGVAPEEAEVETTEDEEESEEAETVSLEDAEVAAEDTDDDIPELDEDDLDDDDDDLDDDDDDLDDDLAVDVDDEK